MNKIKTVVKFEITRQLKKPSFWISLLLIPIVMIGIIGLSALSGYMAESSAEEQLAKANENVIAITDEAGVLADAVLNEAIIKVDSKDEGIEKVKKGEVGEYYYIPADFVETKKAEGYLKQTDDTSLFSASSANLRNVLMASASTRVDAKDIVILTNSVNVDMTTFDEKGEVSNLFGKAVIPIMVLGVFYILICVFGNRMLMAVVEEKENRISEMILTAISSKELIIGKIISLIILGFLQMLVFLIPILVAAFIYKDNPAISGVISNIEFNPVTILANLALLVFSYFLFTGASTMVGAMVPTARDASQYISVVMIGMVLPIMFISAVMSSEPNFMTYFLSYFPLSAPIAMMLRNAFGLLPWYEFVFGIIEIGIFSVLTIYIASKAFQKNAINFSVAKISLKSLGLKK
ncbi:ABC transporter permease [Candidatus Saccharibacteria bacterium]|nr:ABC transporter permease [Candidatus Saccharibacteria bacterium]